MPKTTPRMMARSSCLSGTGTGPQFSSSIHSQLTNSCSPYTILVQFDVQVSVEFEQLSKEAHWVAAGAPSSGQSQRVLVALYWQFPILWHRLSHIVERAVETAVLKSVESVLSSLEIVVKIDDAVEPLVTVGAIVAVVPLVTAGGIVDADRVG